MKTLESVTLGTKQTILHFREYHAKSGNINTWQETVATPCKVVAAQSDAIDCVFHFYGQNIWPLLKQCKSVQYWPRNSSKEAADRGMVESALVFILKNKAEVRVSCFKSQGFTLGAFEPLPIKDYSHFEPLNCVTM